MIWAIKQLFSPMRYLRIRHGENIMESKAVYDWVLPFILSCSTVFLFAYFATTVHIFGENGLVGSFRTLLELLIPFFIAALAAVATFEREGLDKPLKGYPVILYMQKIGGNWDLEELTRRQFICYLFGYLSFLSIILFIFIIFSSALEPFIIKSIIANLPFNVLVLKWGVAFLFIFPIWQLITTTLLGIYFLTERLQVMEDPSR